MPRKQRCGLPSLVVSCILVPEAHGRRPAAPEARIRAAAPHHHRRFRRRLRPALCTARGASPAARGAGRDIARQGARESVSRFLGSRRRDGQIGPYRRRALHGASQGRPAVADGRHRPEAKRRHGAGLSPGWGWRLSRRCESGDRSRGCARAAPQNLPPPGRRGGASPRSRAALLVRRVPGREPGDAAGLFDHRSGGHELGRRVRDRGDGHGQGARGAGNPHP